MKKCLLLTSFFLLFMIYSAYSQRSPYSSMPGKFNMRPLNSHSMAMRPLTLEAPFDCNALLSQNWVYPTGQVYAFCNDAEIACLRKGLLINALKNPEYEADTEALQQSLVLAEQDVQLRLTGCRVAILEGAKGEPFLQTQQEEAKKAMRSLGPYPPYKQPAYPQ